jgi:hypothetical protein
MPKYNVDVYRTGYASNTILVEAACQEEAKHRAMEMIDDYNWNDYDVDYDIRGVEEAGEDE